MIQKHEEDFNEIAYVVVNNNIKNDFVEQINKTLNLEFERNEDAFPEIIANLQNNFKSEQPNLLVLDINETSDKTKNDEIINTIIKTKDILNGWKILILSREKVDTRNRIDTHNLNDNEDVEFLKELFLQKAGERYNDFGDFSELFKIVFYNPLLTEQLALYLHNDPEPATIEDIKKILYGASFKEEDMQGLSADRHDETIVSFLTNLIKYNDLPDNEKNLLRHFVLWQAEYIGYDVIKDLLKGVFESDEDLKNALKSLSKRSILATNNDKTLSYKLHGLLAESIREQIDIDNEDYDEYLDNIYRIRTYNFRDFLPYADCVGNSLCEYEITTYVAFINTMAIKLDDTWKTDYAKKLYDKCIKNSIQRLETEPDIECLEDLSNTYGNLAIFQQNRVKDYESAEEYYNKTIEIHKKIIEITAKPQYLHSLAKDYNNLAVLQITHLNAPESAESNYKEAIKILKKITETSDNPEYLNELSRTYHNFARFQNEELNDTKSAETIFNEAIKIGEKIRIISNNPEYLNQLSTTYNNLANLLSSQDRDESAIENYKKAIEIKNKIKDTNPEYLVSWINSKKNLAACYFATDKLTEAQAIIDEIKPQADKLLEEYPDYDSLKRIYDLIKVTESLLN